MAITIRPVGGLGNQLFIYAAGLAVSTKLSTPLWADVSHFETNENREFELDKFSSGVEKIYSSTFDSARDSGSKKGLRERFWSAAKPEEAVVQDRGFWFDPQVLEAQDGAILQGHLQSWKYFYEIRHDIRERVNKIVNPSDWFLEKWETLSSVDPWIGVHVRRGDYLTIERMGISTDYYYARSIKFLQILTGVKDIIVFSDDMQAARNLPSLKEGKNIRFWETPTNSSPLENLLLLSLCHHLVMANSSFSWWAGWLRDSEDRLVTYPRPWIDFRFINDRDLPMPSWIGMGREPLETARTNHVGY